MDYDSRDSMYQSENASFTFTDDGYSTRDASDGKEVQEVKETRLVIGLDYGTTYTGVAYATPQGNKLALEDIDVMVDWGTVVIEDKVPSVISYSNPDKLEWGRGLSPNAVAMVHTKLELGLQKTLGELDMTLQVLDGMMDLNFEEMLFKNGNAGHPAYTSKNPEDIVTDYLTQVFHHLEQEVEKFGPVARNHTTTDLVVTVPTEWSYMAMNSTYRAMMKAGFNRDNFPRLRDVMFITEPEAAALYTARHYREEKSQEVLQENQYFILCDAGGGTVDIVSYQVKKLIPTLQLEQVGEPTGDKCGSIFINLEFKKWLRNILTDSLYQKLDPNMDIQRFATHASETPAMRALMKEFDEVKRQFGVDGIGHQLELPAPLDNITIPGRVNQGLLTIRRIEMESFFDASILRIVNMIKAHIRKIRVERQNRPKNLFLVGGYGESLYLQAQIKHMLEQEKMIMQFRRPEKSWTAVVRGAVLSGIEKNKASKSLRRTNSCRHSYAVCLDEIYSTTHHSQQDAVHIGGNTFAQSQLMWLLNKGDLIMSDKPCKVEKIFDIKLGKDRQDTLKLPIWQNLSDEHERPTRLQDARDELGRACELDIDLSKIQLERSRSGGIGRPVQFQATLKLVLELDWDQLFASLWWKGKEISRDSVAY